MGGYETEQFDLDEVGMSANEAPVILYRKGIDLEDGDMVTDTKTIYQSESDPRKGKVKEATDEGYKIILIALVRQDYHPLGVMEEVCVKHVTQTVLVKIEKK